MFKAVETSIASQFGVDPLWVSHARKCRFRDFLTVEDGFSTTFDGREERRMEPRCGGIYFWLAENGEAYVGQSVDIRQRLRAHQKNHRDLKCAGFFECEALDLDQRETQAVKAVEEKFALRNILLVKTSALQRPLDNFLSLTAQEKFVEEGNNPDWLEETRRVFPVLERRQRTRISGLQDDPAIWENVQTCVSFYADACLPSPNLTEHRFWSVTGFSKGEILARVNAGYQEVFTIHVNEEDLFVRILSPDALSPDHDGPHYKSGVLANYLSGENCADLFENHTKLRNHRAHVLHLMRHTTSLNARSHCPAVFEPELVRAERNGHLH